MIRGVLRLHRAALIVWTVFVLGSVAYLVWLTEVTADDVQATLDACRDTSAGYCGFWSSRDYSGPMGWTSTFMYYGFWAVAAWSAGALIGRELESGTARLAWTQDVSPLRWLAAKLAVPALVLIAGGTLFVPVFRWAWSAHRDLMGDNWGSPTCSPPAARSSWPTACAPSRSARSPRSSYAAHCPLRPSRSPW
ncbi:hypothetical protein [Streptomyces sp. WM6386]|uniref:hypothetical protein n=1 Tax=Streptomyces sp. WM6386 TaxID=1415558 RepID=UPI000ADB1D56|nr:hypothetical protein [Streptomyces sp. WM6386]